MNVVEQKVTKLIASSLWSELTGTTKNKKKNKTKKVSTLKIFRSKRYTILCISFLSCRVYIIPAHTILARIPTTGDTLGMCSRANQPAIYSKFNSTTPQTCEHTHTQCTRTLLCSRHQGHGGGDVYSTDRTKADGGEDGIETRTSKHTAHTELTSRGHSHQRLASIFGSISWHSFRSRKHFSIAPPFPPPCDNVPTIFIKFSF